jgi:hypothetical protein
MIASRLIVDGQHLLRPNGKKIHLRGVNWGSWGQNVEADAAEMVAIGANCVRVLIRWWGEYGREEVEARDNAAFAFIERGHMEQFLREVKWLSDAGLWVIPAVDSNCGQNGLQAGSASYCDPHLAFGAMGRNFFTDPPMRGMFFSVLKQVAALLRPVPNIAMLELLPEPLEGRDANWAPLVRDFYREAIAAVRQVDAETPFLVGPRGGYEVSYCDEAWLEERADVVYTGNLLSGKVCNPAKLAAGVQALKDMRAKRNVPVLVQQVGRHTGDDPDCFAMTSALSQLSAAKIHFTWWQNKQNTGNPDDYALHYQDGVGGWTPKQEEIDVLAAFLKGES